MAGRGGNYNPTGRNQYSPRPDGGLVSLTFDYKGLQRVAAKMKGEAQRADEPILETHHHLAEILQSYVADELRRAIKAGGRAQRGEQRLLNAITDPRNRRVNLQGFTVGYLDEGWAGEVSKYYRGLEIGTAVHVGRFLRGSFMDRSGRLVRPIEGGKDPRFLQFGPIGPLQRDGSFVTSSNRRNSLHQSGEGPRQANGRFSTSTVSGQGQIPGVRIKNPIVGYHYFARGKTAFMADKFHSKAAIADYIDAFESRGMDFLARAASRGLSGKTKMSGRGLLGAPIAAEPGR